VSKLRWAKLWWSDWENDPALRQCSLAAQGLWMRLLCLAASSRVYGEVLVAGKPPTAAEIARIVGHHHTRVEALIRELEARQVFDRSETGAIQSRRMMADFEAHKRARLDGLNGGNPALKPTHNHSPNGGPLKPDLKPDLKPRLKPEEEAEVKVYRSPRTPPHGGATRTRKNDPRENKKTSRNANIDILAEELENAKPSTSPPVVPFTRSANRS
jgi:hypothetical protein